MLLTLSYITQWIRERTYSNYIPQMCAKSRRWLDVLYGYVWPYSYKYIYTHFIHTHIYLLFSEILVYRIAEKYVKSKVTVRVSVCSVKMCTEYLWSRRVDWKEKLSDGCNNSWSSHCFRQESLLQSLRSVLFSCTVTVTKSIVYIYRVVSCIGR